MPLVVAISAGNRCRHRVFGLTCDAGRNLRPDFAITPAIRFIPSYQHIWNPIAARVSEHENGADVFLSRMTVGLLRSLLLGLLLAIIALAIFVLEKSNRGLNG